MAILLFDSYSPIRPGYEDYAPQDYIIPAWTHPTTSRTILDEWARKPLNFDPGTKWQYSNTNYVLAAEIFEKVAEQRLVAFLKERIFTPLKMESSDDCSAAFPYDAEGYTRYAGGPPRRVAREANGWYNGAGELCMTAYDVGLWDVALLHKEILLTRSYEEFTARYGSITAMPLTMRSASKSASSTAFRPSPTQGRYRDSWHPIRSTRRAMPLSWSSPMRMASAWPGR
ncbi:MAG: serine hydrolase domain-containing protein [Ignavibacteriota bacterium]